MEVVHNADNSIISDVAVHEYKNVNVKSNDNAGSYNPFVFGVILGGLPANIMTLCTENLLKLGADGKPIIIC